jgi:3-mercaptopyruvate sulfurtransferase SseA
MIYIFQAYGHNDVSVLDGGLNKWEADGHDTEEGDVKAEVFISIYNMDNWFRDGFCNT